MEMLKIISSFFYYFYSYNPSVAEQVILHLGVFFFFLLQECQSFEKCQHRKEKMRKERRKSSANVRRSSRSFGAGEKKMTRKT